MAGDGSVALSSSMLKLRAIRNGLRSLPLGRTRALMKRRFDWPLLSTALSGCSVPLRRRRADEATRTSALVGSPKYTWPQAWSISGWRSIAVCLRCLWIVSTGAESLRVGAAPRLLACDGDMPDNSIDLVSCTMLCRQCVDGEASIGVLGAETGDAGALDCIGLSIVIRLTLADIDRSAMGDSDVVRPCLARGSRLSTMALSCCLMDTS